MTTFEVSYGCNGRTTETRVFEQGENNDAAVRFAEKIVELDRDREVWAGWVHFIQVDGDVRTHRAAWTKTSNERETAEGRLI